MTSPLLLFFFLWGDSGVWVWRFRLYHRWNLCFSFLFPLFLFWGDFQEENEAGTSSSHLKTGSLLLYCFLVCPKVKRLLGGWRPVDGSVQKARSLFVCLYSGLCYHKWQSHNWYNEWVQDFVVLEKQPSTSRRPFSGIRNCSSVQVKNATGFSVFWERSILQQKSYLWVFSIWNKLLWPDDTWNRVKLFLETQVLCTDRKTPKARVQNNYAAWSIELGEQTSRQRGRGDVSQKKNI